MANKKRKKDTQRAAVTKVAATNIEPSSNQSPADTKPIKWRWPRILGALLGLSILILFLSWIKFFDLLGVDRWMQDTFISYVSSTQAKQFDDRVVLFLVDKDEKTNPPMGPPDASHRKYHAQLVRLLKNAGASVIVFDVLFQTSSAEVDTDFAKAIQEAETAGTKVVVGAFLPSGIYDPQLAGPIKAAVGNNWGIVDGGVLQKSDSRFIRLAGEKNKKAFNGFDEQPVIPSLALQAVKMLRYPNEVTSDWFSPLAGEVRLRRGVSGGQLLDSVPVNNEMYLLVELPGKDEITHYGYQNILAHFADYASNFKDKIVVIGYQEKDTLPGSEKEPRYGAEMHAAAMSTLLTGVYIRPLPILYHYLAILVLIAIAAYLQIRFSKWMTQMQTIPLPFLPAPLNKITIPTPIFVISLVYILIAVIAFKAAHIVFHMSYHLAALILTYFVFVLCHSQFIRK
jgi:CHASE2 domain-containing sensor protein